MQIRQMGVRLAFVPEDRLGMGLVGNMDIIDNMMLRSYRKGKSMFLERKAPKDLAEHIIEDLKNQIINRYICYMDIVDFREFCFSLSEVEETLPFDDVTILMSHLLSFANLFSSS